MYAQPLVDVVYYGQDDDDNWHRIDKFMFPDVSKQTVLDYKDRFIDEYNLRHITWGVDSRLYVQNTITGDAERVGTVVFFDVDVKGDYQEAVDEFLETLMYETDIDVMPDAYSTNSGLHFHFYEVLDVDDLVNIMKKRFVHEVVDEKFWKSTIKLRGSVLRLSNLKRGESNPIEEVSINDDYDKRCSYLRAFVRNMRRSDIYE